MSRASKNNKEKTIKTARTVILLATLVCAIIGAGFYFFSKIEIVRASPDTETLRPNGAGSETSITGQYPNSTLHWDKVDDAPEPDDDSTYVLQDVGEGFHRDLYALPAHTTGSGTINSVTVYARLNDHFGSRSSGKISIRTNGTTYDTSAYPLTASWANYSNTWTTNPATAGLTWTWDDIDALEAGISLDMVYGSILKGQQVLMADGSQKNIEDIQVGDGVISFDLTSQTITKDKVIEVKQGAHDDYLIFNGVLKTSLDHFIWASGEFKSAKAIKVGDFLLNPEGKEIEVTQIEYVPEKVETFDLIIEKNHNFFASNYLVHNALDIMGQCTQVYVEVDYTPAAGGSAPIVGAGIKILSGMKIQ